MTHRRVATLVSGGLDSAVLLAWAAARGFDQRGFFVALDGETSQKELAFAQLHTGRCSVPLQVVHVPRPTPFGARSGCTTPRGRRLLDQAAHISSVGLSLWVAAIALVDGREALGLALHRDDLDVEPALATCLDVLRGFLSSVVDPDTGQAFQLLAPFEASPRSAIIALGEELGVPFEHTWSCYDVGDEPCQDCAGCRQRADAFAAAGIDDPQRSRPP